MMRLSHRSLLVALCGGLVFSIADSAASQEEKQEVAMLGGPSIDVGLSAPLLPAVAPISPTTAQKFAVGAGDTLKVTVWGYPELSEQVTVLPDGRISYPLVGTVQARGMTAQGLADELTKVMARHVESPQVSVVVADMRSRQFSVIGEVTRSGSFPLWKDELTVLEAVAQAGGLTNTALPAEAKLFRHSPKDETIPVNLTDVLEGGEALKVMIQPGDVFYVPSQATRRKVCVLGEVNVPGTYTLTPGMTVIEAMSAAGWSKPWAVLRSVIVARKSANGEQQFFIVNAKTAVQKQDWSQHVPLEPGDIVYVPKQFFAKVGDYVNFFTSHVEPAAHTYLRVYDAGNPANMIVDR